MNGDPFYFIFFGFIPSFVYIRMFLRTKLSDYLIFAGIFISAGFSYYYSLRGSEHADLLDYQLLFIFGNLSNYLIYLYVYRVQTGKYQKISLMLVTLYLVGIITMIANWQLISNSHNNYFLGIEFPSRNHELYPLEAGFIFQGKIIYSTCFPLVSDILQSYIAIMFLYTYITIKPVIETSRVKFSRNLWKITAVLFVIYSVLIFLGEKFAFLSFLVVLIIYILETIVILVYPEGLLLTSTQLDRIAKFIGQLKDMERSDAVKAVRHEALIDYLESIPSDLLEKGKEQ